MEIEIKGKKIDTKAVLPLEYGDWRYLEKKGVNLSKFTDMPFENHGKIALLVLRKADTTITDDDLKSLRLKTIIAISNEAMAAEELDRPTSTPSTS